MINNTSLPAELERQKTKAIAPTLKSLKTSLLIILIIALVSVVFNILQLLITYSLMQSFSETGVITTQLDNLSKSVEGMTVIVNENTLTDDVNALSQKIDVLSTLVKEFQTNPISQPTNSGLMNTTLHLRFICSDSASGESISECPIHIKVLAVEPVSDFDVQGNNQEAIFPPLRFRLSISVQVSGYQPYANVFEFVETGIIQDYSIKLKK